MEQTTDIVVLLRLHEADDTPDQELMNQAADTIELLRGELKESNAACKAFLRELRKDQG